MGSERRTDDLESWRLRVETGEDVRDAREIACVGRRHIVPGGEATRGDVEVEVPAGAARCLRTLVSLSGRGQRRLRPQPPSDEGGEAVDGDDGADALADHLKLDPAQECSKFRTSLERLLVTVGDLDDGAGGDEDPFADAELREAVVVCWAFGL